MKVPFPLPLTAMFVAAMLALIACDDSGDDDSRRIVYKVSAEQGANDFNSGYSGSAYFVSTDSTAFTETRISIPEPDSIFRPQRLDVRLTLPGDLIPSLLLDIGYRVDTQITLEGGTINVSHTNQASRITEPGGDTLFAVRGEGIVSSGEGFFQNISGFFYEQSTYRISPDTTLQGDGLPQVTRIDCRYELVVDF